VCCRRNNAEAILNASVESNTGKGNVSSNGTVKCSKVQPITQGIPYIAGYTQRTWNALAKEMGLPTITSVGGARLSKLQTRFKECFGKQESIWIEIIDGVRSSVRKHPALAKSSWLSYDYVIRSQETFDKARQGRIALYADKGKSAAEEYVPSYLGGKR
jgi:Asp/Glu/hydantoin racemase